MIMASSTHFCPFARGDFEPRRVEVPGGNVEYTSGQCSKECAVAIPYDWRGVDMVHHGWKCGLLDKRGAQIVTEAE